MPDATSGSGLRGFSRTLPLIRRCAPPSPGGGRLQRARKLSALAGSFSVIAKKLPHRGSWHRAAMTERVRLREFPYIIGITPAFSAHTDAAKESRGVFHRQKVLRLCILHRKYAH